MSGSPKEFWTLSADRQVVPVNRLSKTIGPAESVIALPRLGAVTMSSVTEPRKRPIDVLLVEDSPTQAKLASFVINSLPALNLVGVAEDGIDAVMNGYNS